MTIKQQQARRRALHAMPIKKLKVLYADTFGYIAKEVDNLTRGLSDDGRQIMVDAIVARERGDA